MSIVHNYSFGSIDSSLGLLLIDIDALNHSIGLLLRILPRDVVYKLFGYVVCSRCCVYGVNWVPEEVPKLHDTFKFSNGYTLSICYDFGEFMSLFYFDMDFTNIVANVEPSARHLRNMVYVAGNIGEKSLFLTECITQLKRMIHDTIDTQTRCLFDEDDSNNRVLRGLIIDVMKFYEYAIQTSLLESISGRPLPVISMANAVTIGVIPDDSVLLDFPSMLNLVLDVPVDV